MPPAQPWILGERQGLQQAPTMVPRVPVGTCECFRRFAPGMAIPQGAWHSPCGLFLSLINNALDNMCSSFMRQQVFLCLSEWHVPGMAIPQGA
eukprot:1142729-Pelagomonas_calceolata.AAC.3